MSVSATFAPTTFSGSSLKMFHILFSSCSQSTAELEHGHRIRIQIQNRIRAYLERQLFVNFPCNLVMLSSSVSMHAGASGLVPAVAIPDINDASEWHDYEILGRIAAIAAI